MTTRPLRALAIALVTAMLAVLSLGAPAHADPDRLRVSIDSTDQLFSDTYAPGTITSPAFTITNTSPSRTFATIELIRPNSYLAGGLADELSFSASIAGEYASTNEVPLKPETGQGNGQCLVIGSAYLGPKAPPATATVTMYMDDYVMNGSATFAFRVTLYQVTNNKEKRDACPGKSTGAATKVLGAQATKASFSPAPGPQQLSTPSRSNGFVYALAAGFLAAGGLLLVAARRRREDDPA